MVCLLHHHERQTHSHYITTHKAPTGTHLLSITQTHTHKQSIRAHDIIIIIGVEIVVSRRSGSAESSSRWCLARSLPNFSMTSLPRSPITKTATVLFTKSTETSSSDALVDLQLTDGLEFFLVTGCVKRERRWSRSAAVWHNQVDLKGNLSSISRVTLPIRRWPSPGAVTRTLTQL